MIKEIKTRATFLMLALVILISKGYAQDKQLADSLIRLFDTVELPDSSKLQVLYEISRSSTSPKEKIKYANDLIDLSLRTGSEFFEARGYHHLGVAFRLNGELEKSLNKLFEAASIAERIENFQLLAQTYSEIGTTYTKNSDVNNSLLFKSKAIDVLRKTKNDQVLAINLLNTGFSYYTIDNLDTALAYYNEAEPIFQEIGLHIGTAYTIGNRALVFWKQGNERKAIADLLTAIDMLKPLGDQYGMADYYNQLGSIYLEKDQKEKAIKYTAIGLEMAKAEDLKEQVRDASLLLAQLHTQAQDFEKALEFQTQFIAYKDSIQDQETTQRLADLRTAFEVGQKQAEVDLLSEQKKNRQNVALALGAILLLVAVLLITVYLGSQKRKRLNDELVELNNTKDKFFSIISHDLRGPVSAFSGISRIIKMYLTQKSYDRLEEMTSHIDKTAGSLSNLLDNLLSWAVQQQGQIPFHEERLNLNELVASNLDIFQSTAEAKSIQLLNHVSSELAVSADRNTTMTIFRNLIGNALKFTSAGSIEIFASEEEHFIKVTVQDTGVGMNEEVLAKLFVLEDKKSTYGTSGEKGLGLGLQLVHEFVDLNQGKLKVESTVGEGSTFSFWLPMAA